MSDRIVVTGYGRTEAEAEANARSKLEDIRTVDDAYGIAFGAMSLGMRVVTGYLQLAWAFVLSFSVRPISTVLATLSFGVGLTIFWLLLVLLFGSDAPAREPSAFEEFMGFVLMVIFGSFAAACLAPLVLPATEVFEDVEMALLRRLPFAARAPIFVFTLGWPVLVPLVIVAMQAGWSWAGVADLLGSWSIGSYVLLLLVYAFFQGTVLVAWTTVSPLARDYTWYGAPVTRDAETASVTPFDGGD
jgi:hypothetical protein